MKNEIKERFCSLEELKRTIDCYDGYLDNEEVYYFIGTLRFAYDYITDLRTIEQQYSAILSENAELENKITNLQEENKRLEERCEYLQRSCERKEEQRDTARMEYMEQEDYKQRNEKAKEYNYELQERYCHSALYDDLVASKIYEISEKNIKLLNGGDDNEIF